MESGAIGTSTEPSNLPSFPPFRRSRRSKTYDALLCIYAHLSAFTATTQSPNDPDNDSGSAEQGIREREAKSSEDAGSDFMDHKDHVSQKEIQEVHETTDGAGEKGRDLSANKMVLDKIEMLMGTEETSTQASGDEERKLMDELELAVKGTEDLFRDYDLIPLNSGLGEKQNGGNEVELMDYQVDDVEFLHSDLNTPGDASNGEKLEKLICANNATNSNNILVEEEDLEEGEISGDSGMNGNSFNESFANASILEEIKVDEVQKPGNLSGNIMHTCKVGNGNKGKVSESYSSMVNALQDANYNAQVETGTNDKNGIACGVEVAMSMETIEADKLCSVPNPGNGKDRHIGSKGINGLPKGLTQNQVLHQGLLKENTTDDLGNSSAMEQLIDSSRKRKRGPVSKEKKLKKKIKNRKKRAEKNRELGVTRLKLPPPVQKPKTVPLCRHYLNGRCHEGEKCKFSHDAVPLTKSTPCVHFVRQSCMKGDDCPFDHQLSKYPCNNFVSRGSCIRGAACLFSHQVPTNQNVPASANVCRPELKSPQLSENTNTNLSKPPNNHGKSFVQQKNFTNSTGVYSHIDTEHKLTGTVQKQPALPPKGISFIDVSKLSSSPCTPKQGMITPNRGSLVQIGTLADQSASGTTQNVKGVPKKLPSATPTGTNFFLFGKGPVCSHSESVQEGKKESDNTPPSNVTSALLHVRPLVFSSERLVSGHHKHATKSGLRAFSSTLSFAAEHESDIKIKSTAGAAAVGGSEENK